MAFITLKRVDSKGNLKETLLDTTNIVRVCERKEDDTYLYDGKGDIVETKEGKAYYIVETKVGRYTKLDKQNYDLLVAELTK